MRSRHGHILLSAILLFLLGLLVLGMVLQALVKDRLTDSAFERLENNATVLSQLAAAYYADDAMSTMQFIINLDLTARVSGADALICDETGRIILCSDSPTGCIHQEYSLTEDYLQRIVANGGANDTSVLQNVYEDNRFISARPVYSSATGEVVAIVILSTPAEDSFGIVSVITNSFINSAIIILVITIVILFVVSRRQENPLRELARAARAFGHGDLDARVRISDRHPEEIQELALAFNNMASSLQKSEYSRQEFVANVSHELKTPMTTIGGYVDGILDGTIPAEKQRHYMQIVSHETRRLSRLVRSMLDISQLQGEGRIPEEKLSRFDIGECAGQMLITFEQKILAKNIHVTVDMPPDPLHTVAHQDYISQVIYNLLDNAVKFCPQDGQLSLRIRAGSDKLYVSVANSGPTIPAGELSLLFDRFHKIDKSRTKQQEGWGLGLYIVKTIMGLHNEDISVTSIDGLTEFTFTLPLVN